jgi:hypothetical protein
MQPGMGQQPHMQHPHMQQQPHMQHPHMQQQQPPPGMQQQPPQGGYSAASPQQKTMMAQVSPFQQGGQPQQMGGPQQTGLAPGGYSQAPPNQKTIVAGMAPPIGMPQGVNVPGAPPGFQPGMHPGMQQPPGMNPQQPGGGPNKTVMLQPSDGVVSVARTGQALQPAAGPTTESGPAVQQGASALFWIMSMIIGIGLGVLAYVIVLQTQ